MTIAIAALGETLLADAALERALTSMRAHMVQHVTELVENLLAVVALEHLVFTASFYVSHRPLHEALAISLGDGLLANWRRLQLFGGLTKVT